MTPANLQKNALIFAIPFLLLLLITLQLSRGVFTYTLDDPYIHLTLAKNIWHGNYGINMNEPSAPSSSIIWPFLLAPFSILGSLFQYVPLLLNFVCAVCTALIVQKTFAAQSPHRDLFITFILLLSTNIYGLIFTGMEHSLQLMLVAVIVLALINKHETGTALTSYRFGKLAIASLILLPLVRYEGLAISLPVIAYLFLRGERKLALLSFAGIAVAMGAFSLFLYSRGLGYLPTSVIAKSSHGGLESTKDNLLQNLRIYWFMLVPVGFIVWRSWSSDKWLTGVVTLATVLHFLFGHAGWFGRYEVYYVFFVLMLTLHFYFKKEPFNIYFWLLLPVIFRSLALTTVASPVASTNILYQQGQMAAIAKLLNEPIAVNDLGMVSFESGNYVYDLYGLGSRDVIEARHSGQFNADWIDAHMKAKNIKYAMIYESWFPALPPSWVKVGELLLLDRRITPADIRVAIFATDPVSQQKLELILMDYAKQHPSEHFILYFRKPQ